MGSDKLFHRRKAKQKRDLKRKQAKRAPYDKVLIVCEGEKTEPNYFLELRDHYRLHTANIEICSDCGSAPINVVERAKQIYRHEHRTGMPFDRVYCVFDKDTHSSYEKALQAVKSASPKETFFTINSVPCFEFWLLLHFIYTCKPYHGIVGGKSAGEQVLDDLKVYISDYAKGEQGYFNKLINQLPLAIKHSKQVLLTAQQNNTDNPNTVVHELVEYLQTLGK